NIPEIESFVRVERGSNVVKKGTATYNQDFLYVDDNFFSVFSFPLLSGDPKNVFPNLNSIVLIDETAKKYFGTTDAIGKTIEIQMADKFTPFLVAAVAKKSPQNSSIKFDMLVPMKLREKINPDDNWLNFFMSTFLVLNPKANLTEVLAKMKLT